MGLRLSHGSTPDLEAFLGYVMSAEERQAARELALDAKRWELETERWQLADYVIRALDELDTADKYIAALQQAHEREQAELKS